MSAKTVPLALGCLLAFSVPASADEKQELTAKVQTVFKAHCYRCHGQNGAIEGGMNYIGDLSKLVARKKILPGNADIRRPPRRSGHSDIITEDEPEVTPRV